MTFLFKLLKPLGRAAQAGKTNESTRNQWVEQTLRAIPSGMRILDAGAGEQQYKKYCSHLEYVSQDFGQYNGQGNNAGMQTGDWNNSNLDIVGDITDIPEQDGSFDVVLCTEVFEHLPRPVDAIKEFSRLLKVGGALIVTAPFCSLTHFAPYHFYTGFNRYFYETILTENGFGQVKIEANGNYFEYIAQELRRIDSVAKKYSRTKYVRFYEWIAIGLVLKMLTLMSKTDTGSSELLNYGLHVVARKTTNPTPRSIDGRVNIA